MPQDVVRAGITAAVENADYYRQLEPALMFEMASALGEVRDDVKHVRAAVDRLVEAESARAREFNIKEGMLIALARRFAEGNPGDFDTALRELTRALEVAHEQIKRGQLPFEPVRGRRCSPQEDRHTQ